MAQKGDFILVQDPTLPEGWTKKVCRLVNAILKRSIHETD